MRWTICMVALALAIGSGARRLDAQVASSDRAKTVNAKQSLNLNLSRAVVLKENAIVFRADLVDLPPWALPGLSLTYPRDPGNAFDAALPDMGSSSSSREAYRLASALAVTTTAKPEPTTFQWKPALAQSFAFLMFEHGVRILREPSTRKQLPGKFWKDYCDSVLGLDGWRDGDPFYVNYVGHPMQGAVTGYIQIQNDPRGKKLEFNDPGYWVSRSKAMLWNAAYSVQFEIGPISEASIGNVGKAIDPRTGRSGAAAVDLVVTPTVGTAWLIGEDIVDRYVVRKLENSTNNRYLKSVYRGLLNPDRAFANMLAGKVPWHRDTRGAIWGRRVAVAPEGKPAPDDRVDSPSGALQGLN
jgi:hypothetical protein